MGNADPNHHIVITKKIFGYPIIADTGLHLLPPRGACRRLADAYRSTSSHSDFHGDFGRLAATELDTISKISNTINTSRLGDLLHDSLLNGTNEHHTINRYDVARVQDPRDLGAAQLLGLRCPFCRLQHQPLRRLLLLLQPRGRQLHSSGSNNSVEYITECWIIGRAFGHHLRGASRRFHHICWEHAADYEELHIVANACSARGGCDCTEFVLYLLTAAPTSLSSRSWRLHRC